MSECKEFQQIREILADWACKINENCQFRKVDIKYEHSKTFCKPKINTISVEQTVKDMKYVYELKH
ncbi:hypothetical protein HYD45_00710 [Mycoplasmopsis bovis]|nr:hypothetical protein HYD45_00710 [Mycoplasmopsis bovis]